MQQGTTVKALIYGFFREKANQNKAEVLQGAAGFLRHHVNVDGTIKEESEVVHYWGDVYRKFASE